MAGVSGGDWVSDLIGVSGTWSPSKLKRELLFFDKIVVTDPHTLEGVQRLIQLGGSAVKNEEVETVRLMVDSEVSNFEFLMEKGCLLNSKA
jgi:hypothetical protein